MDTLRDLRPSLRPKSIFSAAKSAVDTARYGSYMVSRIVATSYNGICDACNNLQPTGHELTFGRPEVPWEPRPWADRTELIKTPTLVTDDIPAQKILNVRTKDPKAGEMKSKCVYCLLLCEIFDSFFGFETDRWDHNVMNGSPFKVRFMIKKDYPLIVSCLDFEWDSSIYTSRVDIELYLDEAAIPEAPDAPCVGPAGIRATDSSSESCMSFVRDCVQECRHSHVVCAEVKDEFVPTRLLHIGSNDEELFICESGAVALTGEAFTWAALSHCWGGGQPIKLIKDNISDLHFKVQFDILPPTFRDAIQVARLLDMRYMWIDSLCIVQDDAEDWDREAAMMGMVYSHAFVVISAASSGDPNTPFLGPRDEDWLPRRFSTTTPAGQSISINARRRHLLAAPLEQGSHEPPYTQAWAHNRWKGPLYKRAWCFQETHLAKRTLHFTPGSIVFECRTHRRAEDQLPPYPQLQSTLLGQVDDATKWRMVVRQYTSRNLTLATDKLPAISGVASLLPQAQRSDYIAGLWHESLLYDLLWNVQPKPKEPLAYRGEGYIAPTWSWASLDRAVIWNDFQITTVLAQVLSASCELTGTNAFGQISNGHITLRARVRRCRIFWKSDAYSHRAYFIDENGRKSDEKHFISDGLLVGRKGDDGQGHHFAARATTSVLPFEGELEAAFVCLAKTSITNYNHIGVLITPSFTIANAWERIGTLTNVGSTWYTHGVEAVVTLV